MLDPIRGRVKKLWRPAESGSCESWVSLSAVAVTVTPAGAFTLSAVAVPIVVPSEAHTVGSQTSEVSAKTELNRYSPVRKE